VATLLLFEVAVFDGDCVLSHSKSVSVVVFFCNFFFLSSKISRR